MTRCRQCSPVPEEVRRAGMRAMKVHVDVLASDHPHRTWTTIRALVEAAPLDARVRTDALAVFREALTIRPSPRSTMPGNTACVTR